MSWVQRAEIVRGLEEAVRTSSTSAIIAPNMAKQIVGFQAMMEYAANTFPDLFKGYSLEIKESHQKGKADTSGTAKAMVRYFTSLGLGFGEGDIKKERDPDTQKTIWGIPEEFLEGHGWHTYSLEFRRQNSPLRIYTQCQRSRRLCSGNP